MINDFDYDDILYGCWLDCLVGLGWLGLDICMVAIVGNNMMK
jgi:hypothetical protein